MLTKYLKLITDEKEVMRIGACAPVCSGLIWVSNIFLPAVASGGGMVGCGAEDRHGESRVEG